MMLQSRGYREDQGAFSANTVSRRVAETGHRNHRAHRRQIHSATSEAPDHKRSGPSSKNHMKGLVSIDFFTVPPMRVEILYVVLLLAHATGLRRPEMALTAGLHAAASR
jgi:hypothetical protein